MKVIDDGSTNGHWYYEYRCSKCGIIAKETKGDKMGGSSDCIDWVWLNCGIPDCPNKE